MNLETRARGAAERMRSTTPVDAEDWLRRLHRTHRRRTVGKVVAAAVAIAVGIGVTQVELGRDRAAPVAPLGNWVLVSGTPITTDVAPPVGDEWSKPLGQPGDHVYPRWASVDPATGRFLVNDEYDPEATAVEVRTPGRAEPLVRFRCDSLEDLMPCDGAVLGPGPDEITMTSFKTRDWQLVVVGPDGKVRDTVGPAWTPSKGLAGFVDGFAWSPDGKTYAEARYEYGRNEASLAVVLRQPGSAEESTLYAYSEAAPPWYDAEEHRFADGPLGFNSWSAPILAGDLQWTPDSTRLAFATTTTPEDGGGDRQVRWQLFVADIDTGEVDTIADLGRCAVPYDEDSRQFVQDCLWATPSLTWAPDGESLTVLSDGSLTTYDLTGKVLDSEPTELNGPLVWMESE